MCLPPRFSNDMLAYSTDRIRLYTLVKPDKLSSEARGLTKINLFRGLTRLFIINGSHLGFRGALRNKM